MYVMHLSTMTMQLLPAQMSNRDGEAGMETMLWDISVIPNGTGQEIPYASSGSSTYECVGLLRTFHPLLTSRFTFQHLPVFRLLFVLCFVVALLCFCFLFCKCFGIPNSPRSLDLDDRQGLIASSAMQQKKNIFVCFCWCLGFGCVCCFVVFCFLFCKCYGISNSPHILDLDDRQGLIASSAMQ